MKPALNNNEEHDKLGRDSSSHNTENRDYSPDQAPAANKNEKEDELLEYRERPHPHKTEHPSGSENIKK